MRLENQVGVRVGRRVSFLTGFGVGLLADPCREGGEIQVGADNDGLVTFHKLFGIIDFEHTLGNVDRLAAIVGGVDRGKRATAVGVPGEVGIFAVQRGQVIRIQVEQDLLIFQRARCQADRGDQEK